jgi:hypothetical protein
MKIPVPAHGVRLVPQRRRRSWAAHAMVVVFAGAGLDSDAYVSPVNGPRAEVVA